jgi:hypothetical protein
MNHSPTSWSWWLRSGDGDFGAASARFIPAPVREYGTVLRALH